MYQFNHNFNEQEFQGKFSTFMNKLNTAPDKTFNSDWAEEDEGDWKVPQFLKSSGPSQADSGASFRLFECKCNAKLNGGVEVNEHFESCYQMFPIYGNFMKAFMQLKESAKSEPRLQVNLHILVKQWVEEIEDAFTQLKSPEPNSPEMEYLSADSNTAKRLSVPNSYT